MSQNRKKTCESKSENALFATYPPFCFCLFNYFYLKIGLTDFIGTSHDAVWYQKEITKDYDYFQEKYLDIQFYGRWFKNKRRK